MRPLWIFWVGPKSNDKCPYKKQKRVQRQTGGRGVNCSYAATSQGMPGANRKWKRQRFSSTAFGGGRIPPTP